MTIDYSSQVDIAALMAEISAPLSGRRLQWGSFVLTVGTSAATQSVNFPTPFASQAIVFCSVLDTAAASTGERKDRWGDTESSTSGYGTSTGFSFTSVRASGSANIRVNWIAIGA